MSDEALGVYRASGRIRNDLAKRLLDRVLAEAPAGELACRPDPGALCGHDEPSALPLGRQGGHGLRGGLPGDPVALEAPEDRLVPLAPLREGLRPAHRIALVVDEPDVLEAVQGLLTKPRREPSLPQPAVELGRGLLATRDRTEGGVDRAGAAQLASEVARPRAIELLPHAESNANDDLRRDRPPARSVELHGDPAAWQ